MPFIKLSLTLYRCSRSMCLLVSWWQYKGRCDSFGWTNAPILFLLFHAPTLKRSGFLHNAGGTEHYPWKEQELVTALGAC